MQRLKTRLSTNVLVLLGLLACLSSPVVARNREAAREAFRKATEYHEWLMEQPKRTRTLKQYQQSIRLYRVVIDRDPTYGAADDSLYAIATLYDEMAERFDRALYRNRAIHYYSFVAREYPTTHYRNKALNRASALQSSVAAAPTDSVSTPAVRQDSASEASDEDLATLTEVRYWSNEDYTRVVLQLDREVDFEKQVLSDPDRIYFDLKNAVVDSHIMNQSYDVNGLFIRKIRVAENRPDVVRVVLDFDRINQHTVFALYDPYRIVIDTRGKPQEHKASVQTAQSGEVAPQPTAEKVSVPAGPEPDQVEAASPTIQGNWTLTRTLGLKVGRVVIDPGHGGKDTGTIGPGGLREKDVVLKVALELRDLLEERLGTSVILTRDTDRFVPLEERTAIANEKGADLFVSIHANASRNRRASGVETYVLDFATNASEIEVASRENATAQRNIRDLEDLLKKIALEDYNRESRDLAQDVQQELLSGLSLNGRRQKDRGIRQAPFIVLIGSNMPSILTEIGFISNPEDEKFFKSDAAYREVAEAIYKGIESYFRSLGNPAATEQAASVSGR